MDNELRKRVLQFHEASINGLFGSAVQKSALEYKNLQNNGLDIFVKIIDDFYKASRKTEEDKLMMQSMDLVCQLIIVIYRDCKKQNEQVALDFAHSFINDFPNVQGSCLYTQWEALATASFAFQKTIKLSDKLLLWQQLLKSVQAYNEFINALLGYFIVAWRCALGKGYSINVFNNSYGSKLNEFSQLTDGDQGVFYFILRTANPNLRNAIAHEDIWLDSLTNTVKYSAGKPKTNYEMKLDEMIGFATIGSYLGQAYIVAIATIIVLEEGSSSDMVKLPKHLVKLFQM